MTPDRTREVLFSLQYPGVIFGSLHHPSRTITNRVLPDKSAHELLSWQWQAIFGEVDTVDCSVKGSH